MTDDDVHSALVRWLADLSGATVIKTHQSGDAPSVPYIAVNMTGTVQLHDHPWDIEFTPDREDEDTALDVTGIPVLEIEWRFSCHAYGPNPTNLLRPVRSAVQLAQRQEPLHPHLTIHEVSQIRNVPDWLNNAWEPRAQMDIYVRGLTRDGLVIDVIDEAPVTVTPS